MWYAVIFVFALAGLLFSYTGLTSCKGARPSTSDTLPDSIKGKYTKDEVKAMLEELADKPVKKELNLGAMCYSPRPIPDSATYICPVCGEKTIYTYSLAEFVQSELPRCRELSRRFTKNLIHLDESQYCKKCTPNAANPPKLCLDVQLEGQAPVATCGVQSWDLTILIAFFEGKSICKTFNDGEVAMKDQLPRVRTLLGIKE